ncbi:hypothetical protein Scep_013738 [Stephania cephalantha]|uniref:Uncharacterized protein n=1 Tax=Stephania cephalantha TaxID=152367 RepID=A0AAP0J200_9MAGN
MDEFQLQEQLSFLNEAGAAADATIFPSSYPWGPISSGSHRRSNSVTDICGDPLGTGGLGWKPCLYFARGYCKNGTSCRFLHGLPDEGGLVGSPTTAMEQCHQELQLLRSATKTHQQQQQPQQLRLGSNSSQLINSASFPYPSGKCMNFLLQQQQQQQQQSDPQRAVAAAAAALMLGEDVHKFGRLRIDRNEGMVNPGSRQIYLTFPADSTFREEDVSNYFSIYGPVQDVRIPYQQKRMFGFVTFVYPETVKLILAKGNPHFVCDARVLVKPYKEKGKVPDKKQQQQQQQQQQSGGERGDFSGCSTPTGIDSRDHYDLQQLGGRAFNSTQEMLRRKLEEQQVDLQQAIELQSRRFMGLQLLDVKKHHHQRNLSAGAVSIPSPTHHHHHHHPLISPHFTNGNHVSIFSQSVGADPDRGASPEGPPPPPQDQQIKNPEEMVNHNDNGSKGNGNDSASIDDCGFHSSLEHNLPDSPFASPKKSNGDSPSSISVVGGFGEGERSNGIAGSSALSSSSSSFLPSSNSNKNLVAASSLLPATSSLDIAPFKSCLLQVSRFSSGHGALGM